MRYGRSLRLPRAALLTQRRGVKRADGSPFSDYGCDIRCHMFGWGVVALSSFDTASVVGDFVPLINFGNGMSCPTRNRRQGQDQRICNLRKLDVKDCKIDAVGGAEDAMLEYESPGGMSADSPPGRMCRGCAREDSQSRP